MTRHGRNCTNGSVYTYHERKRDAHVSGYGTDHVRASKDSIKDFDCCCLTLQPCRNPVLTPEGYLYDKEAILQYIITKKNEISRKMKQYHRQKLEQKSEMKELAAAAQRSQTRKFEGQESSIVSISSSTVVKDSEAAGVSNVRGERAASLPSFWIPSLTPNVSQAPLTKPDSCVKCPMSGRPLKMRQLQPVMFSEVIDPDDKRSLIARRHRYKCRVTGDLLGNSVPCAVLRPSGDVVTMDCVNNLIRPDMRHPVSGEPLTEQDIIVMHTGGTGFSGTNKQLNLSGPRPVMQA